ncbi:MAG: sensor domain-containing diguanylate cyclase [Actinomycetota bacterium]|nr:sensor domain-containing diguanylate cyclase [Actinomycetota bacterium]
MKNSPTMVDLGAPGRPITGVRDPRRLAAVAAAELHGHLNDRDLSAVVSTLRLGCRVPIAVVNVVSANLQTYPAEVGIGAACSSVPDGLSFCAEVVDTGRELCVPDASSHPVYCQNPLVIDGVITAYAGVPLVDNGFVLGSVSIFDVAARTFTPDELQILRDQGHLASSVLALRRSARTDLLTGLANRALCLERLIRALLRLERGGGSAAVIYIDVDNFKDINDAFGHDVGDRVLVEVASRLQSLIRSTDTAARFGGDEFVLVCEDVAGAADAELIAERILTATSAAFHIGGQHLNVSLSIGVVVTESATAEPAALLRTADAAMYRAKHLPGPSVVLAGLLSV